MVFVAPNPVEVCILSEIFDASVPNTTLGLQFDIGSYKNVLMGAEASQFVK